MAAQKVLFVATALKGERSEDTSSVEGIDQGKKVRGWSTEETKDKLSSTLVQDTVELIGWRAMSPLDVNQCWIKIAVKIEEEVLDNCKVENKHKRSLQR